MTRNERVAAARKERVAAVIEAMAPFAIKKSLDQTEMALVTAVFVAIPRAHRGAADATLETLRERFGRQMSWEYAEILAKDLFEIEIYVG
jgi:Mg/Co/Ni transporter MgtE